MVQQQITLYTAKICPWAHRTELALKESGLDYKRFEVDLQNKPEWYAPQVNPASKVPAIAYGGPDTPPDQPSPESTKLAESYVLLEFIADLSASTKPLLPSNPVARAKARFFVEIFTSKFAAILPAFDVLQELLPPSGGYAVGEWSIADAAVTPFLARSRVALKNALGAFDQDAAKSVWNTLDTDPKYARYRQYFKDVSERESYKQTFDEAYIETKYAERAAANRAAKAAAQA